MSKSSRVLIANRGEIALRAIQACNKLDLFSVAVFSEADRHSLHASSADRAVCIGPAHSRLSYLNQDALLHTAKACDCGLIYPGYGFLAENADFAKRCEDEGIKFIGPSAQAIARMGDKATARSTAKALGIAVVPGSDDAYTQAQDAITAVSKIGFPVLLKATAGGGGKGMRVANDNKSFVENFEQASQEAAEAFSNPAIYLERYFPKVRHIEVQVFSDQHQNNFHLGERDCTVQRRHQKLLEESPSPVISETERKALTDDALRLVSCIDYEGAGTVEFIFDEDSRQHYFIEMNTRIQVEHPVTELRYQRDLVADQIKVATGAKLTGPTKGASQGLHTMEFRINAENPQNNFMPSPGTISRWRPPSGPGIRVDSFVSEGMKVSPFYDSMVAKLIVAGANRNETINKALEALQRFEIDGIHTTRSFHLSLIHI